MKACIDRIIAAAGDALDRAAAERILEIANDNAERLRREKGRVSAADLREAVLSHHDSLLGQAAKTRAAAYDAALKADREFRTQDALVAQGHSWLDTIASFVRGIYREGKAGGANSIFQHIVSFQDGFGELFHKLLTADAGIVHRLAEQAWRPDWQRGPLGAVLAMGRPSDGAMRLSDDAYRFSVDHDKAKVGDPGAHHLVDVWDKTQAHVRNVSNRNGAFVPEPGPREGHVPVWEDEHRLRIMGKDAWKALVLRTLDVHAPDGEDVGKFLDSKFHELTTGQRLGVFEKPEGGRMVPRDVFRWMEKRWYTPKDGDGLAEYNRQAGSGMALDSMNNHIQAAARANGWADRLGRKPMETMRRLVQRAVDKLAEDGSVPEGVKQGDTKKIKNFESWWTWKALSGEMDIPAGDDWKIGGRVILDAENFSSGYRALKRLKAITGVALVKHVWTAPAGVVAVMRQHGMPLTEVLQRMMGQMLRATSPDEALAARLHAAGFRALRDHMGGAYAATDTAVGLLARVGQKAHWAGGMEWYPAWTRRYMGSMLASEMGGHAGKGWGDLDPKYRFSLAQHGVTPEGWDVIRSARVETGGESYIDPAMVAHAPDSAVDPLIAEERARLRTATQAKLAEELVPEEREKLLARETAAVERMRAKARDGAENLYRQFVAHEIGRVLIDPSDPRVKGLTKGQRGSWTGEFYSNFMLAKGWGIGLGRIAATSQWRGNLDHGSLAQNILRNKAGNFGSYLATMLVAGLMTKWLVDITQGKTPTTFKDQKGDLDWAALGDVVEDSGAFGMYADYIGDIVSKIDQGQWMESLGGPMVSEIGGWAKLISGSLQDLGKEMEGKRPTHKGKGRHLFDLVWGDVPLPNLWYTRAAVDALVLSHIREWFQPGYLAEHERRQRRERGQSSLLGR